MIYHLTTYTRTLKQGLLITLLLCALAVSARAQSFPPAYSATANGYAAGDLVEYNQNIYRSLQAQPKGAIKSLVTPGYWELSELRITASPLRVGNFSYDTFTTFQQAWSFIYNARIDAGATLTIYVDQSPKVFTAPLSLNHPFGSQIFIKGATQAGVVLQFSGCDGLVLDNAHSIGGVSNITVEGTDGVGDPKVTAGTHGLLVSSNAALNTQNLTVSHFDIGAEASGGGTLVLGSSGHPDSIDTFNTYGVYSVDRSLIDIRDPLYNGSTYGIDGRGVAQEGFYCTQGAELKAPGCSASNCLDGQFHAETNGYIIASSAYANGGGSANGFMSDYGAIVDAKNSSVTNTKVGYWCVFSSKLFASGTTLVNTSATADFYASAASFIDASNTTNTVGVTYLTDSIAVYGSVGQYGSIIYV